jgi:hypothetical protein
MTNLFLSGFELNSLTADHEWTNITNSPSISTLTVRTGTYAGNIASLTSGAGKFWEYQFKSADTNGDYRLTYYLNIASYPDVDTTITNIATNAGIQNATLVLTTTGTLKLFRADGVTQIGSASSVLNTGQWYCIELRHDSSTVAGTHTIQARIDQAAVFASATNLTLAGVNNFTIGGNLEGELATTINIFFDDVSLNDGSWMGDGKILTLKPSAAGDVNTFATQTGGTAGAANNFTRVNEVTPNDATSFNGSSTLNQEDLFNMDDSGIGVSDVVNVVAVNARFRNSTADATAAIKFEIEKTGSGTIQQSAGIIPNSITWKTNATAVPKLAPLITYLDPDGAAWTKTTLDSMQSGYKLTTAPGTAGRRIDVTKLWINVHYTPVAAAATVKKLAALGVG